MRKHLKLARASFECYRMRLIKMHTERGRPGTEATEVSVEIVQGGSSEYITMQYRFVVVYCVILLPFTAIPSLPHQLLPSELYMKFTIQPTTTISCNVVLWCYTENAHIHVLNVLPGLEQRTDDHVLH